MKLFKYYKVALILSIFFVLTSCTDTFELHQKYLKDGEIIYTNKVDTLTTFSGNKRIKIQGYISNAFNVNEIVVTWNKGQNSKTFPYTKSSNTIDKLELIIDNLEEQAYQFEVYSKDADGNKSIKMTTFGSVYGENYRSNLEPRAINKFSFNMASNSATVTFKLSDELTRRTEIKYTDLAGAEVIKTLAPEATSIVLDQLDIDKPVVYRTFYVPTAADDNGQETVLDAFGSDWKPFNLPTTLKSILNSVTFEPILGGVKINWTNPNSLQVKFNFKNTVAGSPVINSLTSSANTDSYTMVAMEDRTQTIEISVADAYGFSWTKEYTVTPKPAVKLNRTLWSIVDFDSEEPKEATWGPAIQGRAAAAIDGNLSTFWHSAWDTSQPNFPHYFTIDMGSVKSIASFEMFRRQGWGDGATVHEFWVSNDKVTWTKVGTYNGSLTTNSGVSVAAITNTKGRYVKYLTTKGPKFYTHLAELNIYGVE